VLAERPDTVVIPEQPTGKQRDLGSRIELSGRIPAVDVVVPTRDRPELLRRTIAGILGQNYSGRLRILVVYDQAEPDESLAAEAPEGMIVIIRNTRSPGLAGARNSGILAADADLIAFCDDDDVWLPGKLIAQVDALVANDDAVLACCGIRVQYGDETVDRRLPQHEVVLPDLLASRLMELHPSTFLMRRDAVVDGFGLVAEDIPGSYAEDYELLLRAAKHGRILNVDTIGAEILWHQRSYFTARWDTIIAALTWLMQRYPEFRQVPRGLARIDGQLAFAWAAKGQRRTAARWAGRTLRANPRELRGYLALIVASGAISADRVLRHLHRHGKGI
jgi:glycosyltransferase involved in cell wall biosynthesis